MAWVIAKGTTPIIGVTKPVHIEEAARATEIILTVEEIEVLEDMASKTGVDTRGSWENPMV